jgi:pilus assembly protein CpaB
MKKNVMMPFMLAVAAALIYYFLLYISQSRISADQTMESVAVAALDIKEGRQITRPLIRTAKIPTSYKQKDSFNGTEITKIENLVSRIDIPRGNQITKSALTALSPDVGISLRVLPNYRAFMLDVNTSVSSLVKPNDKVDVLLTFEALLKGGTKEKTTATILQDVQVLGVGGNLGQGMDSTQKQASAERDANSAAFSDRSVISLSVTPIEAQYLALAKEEGEITIIVRSTGDSQRYPIEMSSFQRLFTTGK